MEYITNTLGNLVQQTAFLNLTWGNYIMIAVACFFLYLAIKHGFEPLLLVPIAFGMLLVNIYPDIMLHAEDSANGTGGLLYYFFQLDEWSILPSLIFMGVGAMTDFGASSFFFLDVPLSNAGTYLISEMIKLMKISITNTVPIPSNVLSPAFSRISLMP